VRELFAALGTMFVLMIVLTLLVFWAVAMGLLLGWAW